jgi:uncharacterized protein YndB with AHSA1/START domain
MRFETTVDIQASPERVWQVLRDAAGWPDWSETVDDLRLLDEGPFGLGSRARVKQPKMSVLTWKVTELEPGRSFASRTSGPGYAVVAGHYVNPDGDDRARATLTLEVAGPLAPLLWLFTSARTRRYLEAEAAGLKRHCEQPVP